MTNCMGCIYQLPSINSVYEKDVLLGKQIFKASKMEKKKNIAFDFFIEAKMK